ncbi:MAG: HPr-rel-A system PqqD family peptide chaperone [Methylococcaceae bacterium]
MINFPHGNRIFCRFWEDECVVYNQLTGNTHLIDGIGAEVFKLVAEKVPTRSELLLHVQSIFDLPIDFNLEANLDNLLLEYQKLGLLQVMENSPA